MDHLFIESDVQRVKSDMYHSCFLVVFVEEKLVSETKMRKAFVMELEQIKGTV